MTIEEFQFRAYLQRRLGAVPASILFLLSHAGYGEPYFFVGLIAITAVLAAAFDKTGSTVAPMLAHGTFDAVQLFVFLPLALKLSSSVLRRVADGTRQSARLPRRAHGADRRPRGRGTARIGGLQRIARARGRPRARCTGSARGSR